MAYEADEQQARNEMYFRTLLVALYPGKAKEILAALDDVPEEGEYAEELTEEEMDDYENFSAEEVSQTIDLLRKFGIAVTG